MYHQPISLFTIQNVARPVVAGVKSPICSDNTSALIASVERKRKVAN
jgi:hypothetical protein